MSSSAPSGTPLYKSAIVLTFGPSFTLYFLLFKLLLSRSNEDNVIHNISFLLHRYRTSSNIICLFFCLIAFILYFNLNNEIMFKTYDHVGAVVVVVVLLTSTGDLISYIDCYF